MLAKSDKALDSISSPTNTEGRAHPCHPKTTQGVVTGVSEVQDQQWLYQVWGRLGYFTDPDSNLNTLCKYLFISSERGTGLYVYPCAREKIRSAYLVVSPDSIILIIISPRLEVTEVKSMFFLLRSYLSAYNKYLLYTLLFFLYNSVSRMWWPLAIFSRPLTFLSSHLMPSLLACYYSQTFPLIFRVSVSCYGPVIFCVF